MPLSPKLGGSIVSRVFIHAERIPDELTLPELTLRGLILGALITVVSRLNVYLGLKVGLTFASSIPAAVISMAVLRYFSGANILENNMVQTASAAGTCPRSSSSFPAC